MPPILSPSLTPPPVLPARVKSALPLHLVGKRDYQAWLKSQKPEVRNWLKGIGFSCAPGEFSLAPDENGVPALAVCGFTDDKNTPMDIWAAAHLPFSLPEGAYRLEGNWKPEIAVDVALGWLLGSYRYCAYRTKGSDRSPAALVVPKGVDREAVQAMAASVFLARDLINTPANDLLPSSLAAACAQAVKPFGASMRVIEGEALLKANYPLIHAVGKASDDAPRLIDIRWQPADLPKNAPKITLVGKGVCFDSGGLDIKSSGNMRLMKKDMGGAAVALALARLIMARGLGVRLRLLIPAVENAVSGSAMRPLDVIRSRSGKTVEIGNTDAEGRLILADALSEADDESPDLLLDFATLTGAARVALGTEMPAVFTPDDALAAALAKFSAERADPLYRLPLFGPYRDMLKSKVADLSNDPESGYGGAIAAALFLKDFVEKTKSWLHVDLMAWNTASRPGRPQGGEAQTLRALFALIEARYGR